MNDMKNCLFDAYCEYTEEKQLEYQKTEQYQELQRQLDENKRAIDRLIFQNPELQELFREREDLLLKHYTDLETETIKALISLIHH